MLQARSKVPHLATLIASAALAIVVAGVVALAAPGADASGNAPSAPGGVTASRDDNNKQTIKVSWTPVDDMTYNVNHTNDDKRSWQRTKSGHTCNNNGCIYNIHGTWLNADYTFAVQACNASNQCSGWTNSNLVSGAGTPNPPSVVHIKHHGSWVHLWWPKPHGGASTYDIVASKTHKKSWWRLLSGYRQNVAHIKNADPSKTYYIAVRACNHSGNGNTRACSGWRNSAAGLPPPPSSVSKVFATFNGKQLTAKWTAAKGATKYHATYGCQSGQSLAFGDNHWEISGTSRTHTITIASRQTAEGCQVGVRAGNAQGWSAWTNSAPAVQPATAPTNLKATTSTSYGAAGGTITTTWTAGQHADGYNVNYRADGGQWKRVESSHTTTTHTGTVTQDKLHTVAVQSVNDGGGSQWSNYRPAWLRGTDIRARQVTPQRRRHQEQRLHRHPLQGESRQRVRGNRHG